MIHVVRISQWLYFRGERAEPGQLSQLTFRLIGQDWPVARLITATPHQVMAAQLGTGSVWRAAHDWECRRWGGGGCSACWPGLFWGQPANRDTFLIIVTDLEGSLTFGVCQSLDQAASMPDVWRPGHQNDWRDVFCVHLSERWGLYRFISSTEFLSLPVFLSTKAMGGNRWR